MPRSIAVPLVQIVRLDVAAARARYSTWIGGNLPAFVPFARMARGRKVAKKGGGGFGGGSGGNGSAKRQRDGGAAAEEDEDLFVRLRRLRQAVVLLQTCSLIHDNGAAGFCTQITPLSWSVGQGLLSQGEASNRGQTESPLLQT